MTLEGRIIGFDEYMNIVLDESHEWYINLSYLAMRNQALERMLAEFCLRETTLLLFVI